MYLLNFTTPQACPVNKKALLPDLNLSSPLTGKYKNSLRKQIDEKHCGEMHFSEVLMCKVAVSSLVFAPAEGHSSNV